MVEGNKAWNLRAGMALLAFLVMNGVAAGALFLGRIDFQAYWGAAGTINGVAIGWLFRDLAQK
jgi:hypothetical protein